MKAIPDMHRRPERYPPERVGLSRRRGEGRPGGNNCSLGDGGGRRRLQADLAEAASSLRKLEERCKVPRHWKTGNEVMETCRDLELVGEDAMRVLENARRT